MLGGVIHHPLVKRLEICERRASQAKIHRLAIRLLLTEGRGTEGRRQGIIAGADIEDKLCAGCREGACLRTARTDGGVGEGETWGDCGERRGSGFS